MFFTIKVHKGEVQLSFLSDQSAVRGDPGANVQVNHALMK